MAKRKSNLGYTTSSKKGAKKGAKRDLGYTTTAKPSGKARKKNPLSKRKAR